MVADAQLTSSQVAHRAGTPSSDPAAILQAGYAWAKAHPDEATHMFDLVQGMSGRPEPEQRAIADEVQRTMASTNHAAVSVLRGATSPVLQEQVARALVNAGVAHSEAGQIVEALARYAEVVTRFEASALPALQEQVALALVDSSIVYGYAKLDDEAIAACDEVIRRYGDTSNPTLQKIVGMARQLRDNFQDFRTDPRSESGVDAPVPAA